MDTSKILFVINPISGAGKSDQVVARIHDLAAQKSIHYRIHFTTGKNDDEAIRTLLKYYKPDKIVAAGGDGTIELVARNIIHTNLPMGIIALGSANGLATALGLPVNHIEAIDTVVSNTKTIPLDMLRINDKHLCIHLSDIGINALMVKNYIESGEHGMMGYLKHLMHAIRVSPLLRYRIVTPEQTYEMEGYMLSIANAHKYGTGIQISEGSVSDGYFEICNVPKVTMDDFIKAGLTKFNVFIEENMFKDVISCKKAEIMIDRKIDFQIDGEYFGLTDYLKVEIVESAVNLLVP